jgi:hypothetical protein
MNTARAYMVTFSVHVGKWYISVQYRGLLKLIDASQHAQLMKHGGRIIGAACTAAAAL